MKLDRATSNGKQWTEEDQRAAWREANLRCVRGRNGFTKALILELRAQQEGRCAICRVQLVPGRTDASECADHCHVSLRPRGLLCFTCNKSLGHYEKIQRPRGLVLEPYDQYLARPPVDSSSFSG